MCMRKVLAVKVCCFPSMLTAFIVGVCCSFLLAFLFRACLPGSSRLDKIDHCGKRRRVDLQVFGGTPGGPEEQ